MKQKRPYDPPAVISFPSSVDDKIASAAWLKCQNGGTPQGGKCQRGHSTGAVVQCKAGGVAQADCTQGSTAQTQCSSGGTTGGTCHSGGAQGVN